MAVYYRPIGGVPPWVRERAERMGWETMATVLRGEAAAATSNGDSASAALFTAWNNTIEASAAYSGGAKARVSFMVMRISAHT